MTIERTAETFRVATVERQTRETRVRLVLGLDGRLPLGIEPALAAPDGFFVHMLDALATHGGFGVRLEAEGDTQVDLHHTVEDVGIAFGDGIAQALGDKRGVSRFAHAYAPLDEALARAVVDLSGRGFFAFSAPDPIAASWVTASFPFTLVADFFGALADRGRLTLHLDVLCGRNPHHAAEAAFKAAALALRHAVALRQAVALRPAGIGGPGADAVPSTPTVPSTKGTLDR